MDTSDLLRRAWEAVEKSGVPPELHEVAFTVAVAHIGGPSPSTPTMVTTSATPQSATRLGSATGATVATGAASNEAAAEVDSLYRRLAEESGVAEDHIREVILIEPPDEVVILTAGRNLGDNTADKARTVASLMAGVYAGGLNRPRIPVDVIRDACNDRGCYDSTNFKTKHIGRHPALSVRGDDAFIASSKWSAAFEEAIGKARGAE